MSLEEIKMSNWISIKDKLPKERTSVIISIKDVYCTPPYYHVVCGWLLNDCWVVGKHIYYNNEITHWMPLPEPPKEES